MKYYTDGFLHGRGNPCAKGGGYTITDDKGKVVEREVVSRTYLTNNEAEVMGIIRALEICKTFDEISSDSKCCIIWIKAGFSKARPDLENFLKIGNRLWHLKQVNLRWESRWKNKAGFFNQFKKEQ